MLGVAARQQGPDWGVPFGPVSCMVAVAAPTV